MDKWRFRIIVMSDGQTEHLNRHAHVLLSHKVSAKDRFTEQICWVEGHHRLHWLIKHLLLAVVILYHKLLEASSYSTTVRRTRIIEAHLLI